MCDQSVRRRKENREYNIFERNSGPHFSKFNCKHQMLCIRSLTSLQKESIPKTNKNNLRLAISQVKIAISQVKIKVLQKILKAARQKGQITYRGTIVQTSDFSPNKWSPEDNEITSLTRAKKKLFTQTSIPSKTIFQN